MRFLFLILALSLNLFAEERITPACLISEHIKQSLKTQNESVISSLIAGIEARDADILLSIDEQQIYSRLVEQERKIEAQKNLVAAEAWLEDKVIKKNVKVIIPNKLAYKVIKQGLGEQLKREHGRVLVNFTIKTMIEELPETLGRNKEIKLEEIIPGLAQGMLFMREGEVRTVYIHPQLAYDSYNFDPNMALEATVELLQILPGKRDVAAEEILLFNKPEVKEDLLQQQYYYVLGWKLWDLFRWGSTLFSKKELIQHLNETHSLVNLSLYEGEINKIYWHLYYQKSQTEKS